MSSAQFPIIGIGASAGGIDAFHAFFNHMPADCGMAFVMILHLPADRKSMLGSILSHWTSMPVVEAIHGTKIEPNHVYVPPPHAIVSLVDGHLGIEMPPESTMPTACSRITAAKESKNPSIGRKIRSLFSGGISMPRCPSTSETMAWGGGT